MSQQSDPTTRTYGELTAAYDHFNRELFEGRLPPCIITLQRKNKCYGFFVGNRFGTRDHDDITDEIALNPRHFLDQGVVQVLSTLVHEMTHLEQHHHGDPGRNGYHNKEWAGLMRRVGLIPSATEAPGGKDTGQHVSHYIETGGRFEQSCVGLLAAGSTLSFVEWANDHEGETRKKKAASKTKYICPSCAANAWAKPNTQLVCGDCWVALSAGLELALAPSFPSKAIPIGPYHHGPPGRTLPTTPPGLHEPALPLVQQTPHSVQQIVACEGLALVGPP
jgi:predicted SprT family Zn-dependent metalloprotease